MDIKQSLVLASTLLLAACGGLSAQPRSAGSGSMDTIQTQTTDGGARDTMDSGVNGPPDSGAFHYDERDGTCKDADGQVGFNKITATRFVDDKGGECGTFASVGIVSARIIASCGGRAPCTLDGWNFRGADLNSLATSGGPFCGLNFKHTDLRGAHMDKLGILYTCIEGNIDAFTKTEPSHCGSGGFGCCITGDQIDCIK